MKKPASPSALKTILLAGFVAGTLDILSAIIFLGKGNWSVILKYVASGAFGYAAMEGGNEMIAAGLVFHYSIAYSFTLVFFIAARYISFLQKKPVIAGLLYGILVWFIMNYLVLPFTHIPSRPFSFSGAIKNILILMLAIGLPVSLITAKYYSNKINKV